MKYIEKVILENFQSHKNSTIEFDNHLNVIVGPSDSGKTAILRGIRWALYNEPSGDYFIREGASECSVTIVFSDKTKIKRYRSKSKNVYTLYDSDNNVIKFEGFGTSVPEDIIEKTGIKKILLDSDLSNSINISDQLEGAFLLSERASTRANSIGRLVGVNIIDDALRESLKDSRNLINTKKNMEDIIQELDNELHQYEYLDELATRINKIEEIRNVIHLKSKLINRYRDLLEKNLTISQEKNKLASYINELTSIDQINEILNEVSSKINIFIYLNKQLDKVKTLSLNKQENHKIISYLKDINTVENNLNKMDSSLDLRAKLINHKSKIIRVKEEINKLQKLSNTLKDIRILQDCLDTIDIKIFDLKKLADIKDRDYSLRKRLAIGNSYVEKLKEIEDIVKIYTGLNKRISYLSQLKKLSSSYESNKDEINRVKLTLQRLKEEVDNLLSDYKELLLKQETCPLCFSIIDNDKIKHILNHYN